MTFMVRLPEAKGQNNIAFASLLQLGDAAACVDLLVKTDRAPEAALFARTYAPRYDQLLPGYLEKFPNYCFEIAKHQKP